MLDALHRRGRSATGLERHSNRPDVRSRELAECEGGWAAIVMWHSLEHLPAPRQALRDAAERLAPRGKLVVAVPNIASLQAQFFRDDWLHLDLPRHLSHLTAKAVTGAMKADGLVAIQVSYLRGGQVTFGWLDGMVGSLPGHPDLYQAIRRPAARESSSSRGRWATLAVAAVLSPVALVATGLEVSLRRGGTVCLVARQPGESLP
jgi:SAM-dependent methyltransferase